MASPFFLSFFVFACFSIFKSTPYLVCLDVSFWSFQPVLTRHLSCTAASDASWMLAFFNLCLALTSVHISVPVCARYLPCCCDKVPDRSDVIKGELTLAHSPRLQFILVWEGMVAGA